MCTAPLARAPTALLVMCLAAWPGNASSAPPLPEPSRSEATSANDDERSLLPKTLIYVSVASLIDLTIGYVVSGGLATGTAIAVVNSASGWVLYHLHETAWAAAAPPDPSSADIAVTRTATFTAANSIRLLGIGLLFTQSVATSVGFLVLNAAGDAGAYVVTDRIWSYVVSPQATATGRP
jgi:uncharacterized membrane protein